jgi:hypothetical protein
MQAPVLTHYSRIYMLPSLSACLGLPQDGVRLGLGITVGHSNDVHYDQHLVGDLQVFLNDAGVLSGLLQWDRSARMVSFELIAFFPLTEKDSMFSVGGAYPPFLGLQPFHCCYIYHHLCSWVIIEETRSRRPLPRRHGGILGYTTQTRRYYGIHNHSPTASPPERIHQLRPSDIQLMIKITCRTYEPGVKAPALHVLMFEIDPENEAWYSFNAQAFFNQYIRFPVPSVPHTRLVMLCSASGY